MLLHPEYADDDVECDQFDVLDKKNAATALSADDVALLSYAYDDDEESYVYDYDRAQLCDGEDRVYCTRYLTSCYAKPRHCLLGPVH